MVGRTARGAFGLALTALASVAAVLLVGLLAPAPDRICLVADSARSSAGPSTSLAAPTTQLAPTTEPCSGIDPAQVTLIPTRDSGVATVPGNAVVTATGSGVDQSGGRPDSSRPSTRRLPPPAAAFSSPTTSTFRIRR